VGLGRLVLAPPALTPDAPPHPPVPEERVMGRKAAWAVPPRNSPHPLGPRGRADDGGGWGGNVLRSLPTLCSASASPKSIPAFSTCGRLLPSPHRSEIMTSGWCGETGVPQESSGGGTGRTGGEPRARIRNFVRSTNPPHRRGEASPFCGLPASRRKPRRGRFPWAKRWKQEENRQAKAGAGSRHEQPIAVSTAARRRPGSRACRRGWPG
jgi:hypothetical protein